MSNNQIDLIVFSKDRAMQLDLLLQSISKHCNIFKNINILYTYSNPRFEEGYVKVKEKWNDIKLIKEVSFEQDVLNLVRSSDEFVCILSDDCIFYREVTCFKNEIIETISKNEIYSFILGIGGDSEFCAMGYCYYARPTFQIKDNVLVWNWKQAGAGEFSCPFMLAANIYKREDYLLALKGIEFGSPSFMEFNLQNHWQHSKRLEKDYCACLKHQALVHTTNNRVQDHFRNDNGITYPFASDYLNDKFLNDEIVDIDNLDFSKVNGLHKEINLKFKKC